MRRYTCLAVEIYRAVYGDHHYLVAIALSNVGGIAMDKKDYPRAEKIFRDVIRPYSETLPADNVNLGIAHVSWVGRYYAKIDMQMLSPRLGPATKS